MSGIFSLPLKGGRKQISVRFSPLLYPNLKRLLLKFYVAMMTPDSPCT